MAPGEMKVVAKSSRQRRLGVVQVAKSLLQEKLSASVLCVEV